MTDPAPDAAPKPKRVFLSYAWEDTDYKLWVKRLATRLRADGIDARLDAWHLGESDHIAEFMNREVRHADWVLVICSPEYQKKVRATEDGTRVAGVGWETRLLSGRQLGDNVNKVLAVLGRGEWSAAAPDGMLGQNRYDLSNPATFEQNYRDLLRAITGTTEHAPALGKLPADIEVDLPEPLRGTDPNEPATPEAITHQASRRQRVDRTSAPSAGRQADALPISTTPRRRHLPIFLAVVAIAAVTVGFVTFDRWRPSSKSPVQNPVGGPPPANGRPAFTAPPTQAPVLHINRWLLGGWEVTISNPNMTMLTIGGGSLVAPDSSYPVTTSVRDLMPLGVTTMAVFVFDATPQGQSNLQGLRLHVARKPYSTPCSLELVAFDVKGERHRLTEGFNCGQMMYPPE